MIFYLPNIKYLTTGTQSNTPADFFDLMDEDYNPEDDEHNFIAPIETHRTTVIPAPIQVEPVVHVENDFEKNKKRREAELHFVKDVRSEVSKEGVCNQNCESMVFF